MALDDDAVKRVVGQNLGAKGLAEVVVGGKRMPRVLAAGKGIKRAEVGKIDVGTTLTAVGGRGNVVLRLSF